MPDSQPTKEPTPFERFTALTKRVVATPKAEIDKREADYKAQRTSSLKKPARSAH